MNMIAAQEVKRCGNVVFPTANILEDNGEVKIYYGAADTVLALATANLNDLLRFTLGSATPK